jgi:hypothetical protein
MSNRERATRYMRNVLGRADARYIGWTRVPPAGVIVTFEVAPDEFLGIAMEGGEVLAEMGMEELQEHRALGPYLTR